MNALITVFLSGLGGHVLIGLLQVITRSPVGLPGELALAANRPGAAVLELAGSRWLRAYGLTFHPNVLGGLLAIGLLLGLPLLDRRRIRLLWWWCWLGLLITFSRSAWLAVGLVLPLVVAWLWWRIKKMRLSLSISLAGVGGILILGAVALKPQLTTRLNPGDSSLERISLQERGELIRLALASIRARPLVGVGAGNFPLAVLASGRPLTAHAVHNIPLLLATEIGVIGGLLWYWLWFAPSTRISQYVHASDPWPVVLYAAWFAFGIISLWDSYPWALNSGLLLSAALLGLIQPHLSANSASGGGTATARSKSNRR